MKDIDESKNKPFPKRENAPLSGKVKEFALGILIVAIVILVLLIVIIVITNGPGGAG